ncbi:hypothetical protein CLV33_11641 [Jejuia pallidilutea]|uniref:Uncharacterized protein n=1 Tax=Jejuia pallidilutea TaxID=504487 RepID=A0A362WWQ3_9FLAO|nr:hypothetical protein CLV33_11641 [Jejuia pallidilutea]
MSYDDGLGCEKYVFVCKDFPMEKLEASKQVTYII